MSLSLSPKGNRVTHSERVSRLAINSSSRFEVVFVVFFFLVCVNILINQLGTRIFHLVTCFDAGGISSLYDQEKHVETQQECALSMFFHKEDKAMSQEMLYY